MRKTVRGIIVDPGHKILLIKYLDEASPSTRDFKNGFWVMPGGGVEVDESFEAALKREIFEETGMRNFQIGQCLLSRLAYANLNSIKDNLYYERYYLVKVKNTDINFDNITEVEKKVIKTYKWWTIEEVRESDEIIFPKGFKNIIDPKIFNNDHPIDLTVTRNLEL